MRETADFYSALASAFHLVYPDWKASTERQASDLDTLIREQWGEAGRRLLDVACGVGTQALGLAVTDVGFEVRNVAKAAMRDFADPTRPS